MHSNEVSVSEDENNRICRIGIYLKFKILYFSQ